MAPAEFLCPDGCELQGGGHAIPAGFAGARPGRAPPHASKPLTPRLCAPAACGRRRCLLYTSPSPRD
eukprot:14383301-Alexandrium_andersonii.AAC.1